MHHDVDNSPKDNTDDSLMDRDFDIMEMPVSGLAAYWLSLKKILDDQEDDSLLLEESQHTSEPYISHILRLAASPFGDERVSLLAKEKKRTLLHDLRRKLDLVDITVRALFANENPRLTIVRMNAIFSAPRIAEHEVFETATQWLASIREDDADLAKFAEVDHVHRSETLLIKLIFCQMYARRMGRDACRLLAPYVRFGSLSEAFLLIADGFEEDIVISILRSRKKELLSDTACKMDMALELALGVRNHFPYEDIFTIAMSYMNTT